MLDLLHKFQFFEQTMGPKVIFIYVLVTLDSEVSFTFLINDVSHLAILTSAEDVLDLEARFWQVPVRVEV